MKTRAKAVRKLEKCWAVYHSGKLMCFVACHPVFARGGGFSVVRGTFIPAAPKPGGKGRRK